LKSCAKTGRHKKTFSGVYLFSFVFLTTEKLNTGVTSFDDGLMKKWVHRALVLSILTILFAVGKASAQDAGMSDVEVTGGREAAADADKVVFSPGESEVRYVPKASGVASIRDSTAVDPMKPSLQKVTPKAAPKEAKPKDDSVLTFNFLYYIIQKYKLQDIID
jgi:hypothetical protein